MKLHRYTPLEQRFWSQVDKSGDCWLWTGNKTKDGYGRIRVNGKQTRAHRAVWLLTHGSLPPVGTLMCHKCDVRACVRPDHLFVGTYKDNSQDAISKGRALIGVANPRAKLSEQDVIDIRRRADPKLRNLSKIAREYAVTNALIGKILRREIWPHVAS